MDFNINIPVKVISGVGCVSNNSDLLKSFGSSAIIITGGTSAKKSGALDDVISALEKQEIKFVIYNKITENPRLDHCHEAGQLAAKMHADFVIGIGGGSPLDAAKAVAVYAANEHMTQDEIYSCEKRNKALPIVAIGTTAGTGSEVGRVSVLTNPETGRKKSISPTDCCPSLTFADPTYTHSMPYKVTVSTALDAMAHALEGYMSLKCGDIPTLFGEKAISLIWDALKYFYETKALPDAALREKLYYASLYAGITLSYCGTAFPHPLGYILTENYNVPHGMACAAFMTDFMKRAEQYTPEKAKRIYNILNTTSEEFEKVIIALTDVGNITMSGEEIQKHCSRFDISPANFTFSPGEFTKEDAINLFCKKFSAE